MASSIHITDIEAAINHWRRLKPSPDGVTLAPELRALAEVYALMIYHHQDEAAEKDEKGLADEERGTRRHEEKSGEDKRADQGFAP